ncbi:MULTISPECIES: hypothetical protein [unclassified Luteococcus]|uniref:hypothetical protein n=1 Tax=unclassified Luteococcus TaxID=2639923 RepID=UPI00313CC9DE
MTATFIAASNSRKLPVTETTPTVPELTPFNPAQPSAARVSSPLPRTRLQRAKMAYTTRFFAEQVQHDADGHELVSGSDVVPRAGDLVLARVVEIGKHTRLESPQSRRQLLFPGDEIVVAYGHRYAPDQFEAEVPTSLEQTNLVAAGGLAGRVTAQHASIDAATVIQPLGLVARDGEVLNLTGLAPHRAQSSPQRRPGERPRLVTVLGTSMNSGKSTTLACLINGLTAAGLSVAAGKATGTGAGGDPRMFVDAGASTVLDFTDFGHGSTYRLGYDELKALVLSVMAALSHADTDVVVLEIADGIYQGETSRLIADPEVQAWIDTLVFAAGDALGATKGVDLLAEHGLRVAAVSGVVTASPLATREADAVLPVSLVPTFDLTIPETAREVLGTRARA